MFNFSHYRKREEVQKVLTHRVNHALMDRMREGERKSARTGLGEIVFLVPSVNGRPDYRQAVPVIGKDMSVQGLSLIHTAPVAGESLYVALQDEPNPRVLHGKVEHCTPLGFGFHQIGLLPHEVVAMDDSALRDLRQRLAEFDRAEAALR